MKERNKEIMHESMQRLYQAAKELTGIEDKAVLSRRLEIQRYVLSNWEERGLTGDGAINAEIILGCSAVWTKYGIGEMCSEEKRQNQQKYSKNIQTVIKLMLHSDQDGQEKIRLAVTEVFRRHQAFLVETKAVDILPAHRAILSEEWTQGKQNDSADYQRSPANKSRQWKPDQ